MSFIIIVAIIVVIVVLASKSKKKARARFEETQARTVGKVPVQISVVGVSFYQEALKKYNYLIRTEADLELHEYEGKPAYRVVINIKGKTVQIGSVPKGQVTYVTDLLRNNPYKEVEFYEFEDRDEDADVKYGARLYLYVDESFLEERHNACFEEEVK